MIPPSWGSLFMGDVYADANYSLSVTKAAVGVDVVPITKGSWWANPMTFFLWLNQYLINSTALKLSVSTYDYRDTLCVLFSDDRTIAWTGTGNLPTEVGMPSNTVYGASNPCVVNGWWTTFPVSAYNRATKTLDGVSVRSHSGKTYSIQGDYQGERRLITTFDRRVDTGLTGYPRYEYQVWRSLWRKRWNVGRSVSFWLELPKFVVQTTADVGTPATSYCSSLVWGDTAGQVGKFDQLIIVPENKVWRPSRMIEAKEFADVEEAETTFYLRPKNRRSDTWYNDLYVIAS